MNLIDAFLDLLYPPKCIICEEPISDYGYCAKCVGKLISNRSRIFEGKGFIEDLDGNLLVTGKALYFKTDFSTQ